MIQLSLDDVLQIHFKVVKATGGTQGIREMALLESAIASPNHSFFGNDLYYTIQRKAARLCYSLIQNHAFLDGNKRVGVLAMLVLLDINGVSLKVTDAELSTLGWNIANGKYSYLDVLNFINAKE